MWTVFSVMSAIWPLLVEAESNPLYDYTNGWIPVSSEVVYNQIKREGTPASHYIAAHNIQLLHTGINRILPAAASTAVNSKKTAKNARKNCLTEDATGCNQAKFTDELIQDSQHDFVPNSFHLSTNQNETDNNTLRRSKKIADLNLKNYVQDLFLPESSSLKSKINTYEVTEDILEHESKASTEGYNYEPPKIKNQTNGLFEILSKYKITKDDELSNYDLSRKLKARIPSKPNLPTKSLTQIPYRHNNLNHLPVDPLLAVFLSNYGFYLQGMYGINNHYNNLYGYLASNNIHNNRPFGVYKIYSDTDSSH